jgi:wobble nucleotide-excising tRNase
MKQPTLNEILQLRNIVLEKTEEVAHYQRVIADIRATYKSMSKEQLEQAVRDIREMEGIIAEHDKFCNEARKTINEFFKPAVDTGLSA